MKYSWRVLSVFLFVLSFASCDTGLIYRDPPAPEREEKQLLALSMEGGGIRGYMQVYFLKLLEEELVRRGDVRIPEKFDLFTGASIGGIHALMFAVKGSSAEEAVKFYQKSNFERIFKEEEEEEEEKSLFDKVWGYVKDSSSNLAEAGLKKVYEGLAPSFDLPPYKIIPNLYDVKFAGTEKHELLLDEDKFGNLRLSDARKEVIVPAYRFGKSSGSSFYFSTIDYDGNPEFNAIQSIKIADIGDATSAVPLYFPMTRIKIENEWYDFLDGVLVQNNLSSMIIDIYLKKGYQEDEIKILHLGTGRLGELSDEEVRGLHSKGAAALLGKGKIAARMIGASADRDSHNAAWRISNFVEVPFSDMSVGLESMTDFSSRSLERMREAADAAWEKHKDEILRLLSD